MNGRRENVFFCSFLDQNFLLFYFLLARNELNRPSGVDKVPSTEDQSEHKVPPIVDQTADKIIIIIILNNNN